MADVGAEPEVFVAPLKGFGDRLWVPKRSWFGVVVEANFQVIYFCVGLKPIDCAERFGRDPVEAKFFSKFKDLASTVRVIWNVDHSQIDRSDCMMFEVVEQFLDRVIREIGTKFLVCERPAEALSWEDFYCLGASGGRHLDGLEEGKLSERPALDGNREIGGG